MSLQTILNFLIPPKPDHPDISGRLDLLAKYGPIVNYHILDNCICKVCRPKIREKLKLKSLSLKIKWRSKNLNLNIKINGVMVFI